MDLHRDFADSQRKSYLLIEHAGGDQPHDLTLAFAQGLVAFSQLGGVTPLTARCTVTIQSLVDGIQQVLVQERLGQELHRTGFHGLYGHRDISVTGDEDDRNLYPGVTQLPLKVQTVDARQAHVENKAAWPAG